MTWLSGWLHTPDSLPFSPAGLLDCFTAWVRLGALFDAPLPSFQQLIRAVLDNVQNPQSGKGLLPALCRRG